jgi:ATP-binding cassette subfamily B protein
MSKLKRFFAYYRPHKGLLILDLSCAVLVSMIDIAYPMFTQYILRTLLPQMAIDSAMIRVFVSLMIIAFGAYVVRALLLYIINYWGHVLGVRMEADIRRDIFSHIQELSFSFYDKVRTGKLMSRVTTDLFDITELAHHGPEDILISGTTVIGAFIVMMFVDWRLALALLCIVPVAIYYVVRLRVKMRDASLQVKERVGQINADIESSISGARVAKAFTNEKYEREKFEKGNATFVRAKNGFYRYMALFSSGMEFFIAMFNVVVLALGGYLIYKSSLDPILLITFSLYIAAFVQPLKRLAAFAEVYILGMAGFTRFCEIMDIEPEIKDRPHATTLKNVKGDICFDDVTFAYESGKSVLSHVNLDIPAGRTLALVGPSGGGKTTLCHLIPRFYEQRSGSITIDGVDTREVTMRSLRQNVGIVQQDVFLFASRIDATDEEVIEAAKRAHIHEEILQFSDGYDTQVGERGIMLSGGQKQRVSIARLFLKNPPVLILDEATSALDTVTEHDIQHSFEELSRGRTTLVIAHRLSTVKHADEIVVLDEQGVRERGTHEELLAANGQYAQMYHVSMID